MQKNSIIRPQPKGERLAVLMPGLGAVATTAIAGVEAVKRGLAQPIGSFTQLGHLLDENGGHGPAVRDVLPIVPFEDIVFGGWDPIPDNVYEAALRAKVLDKDLVNELRPQLEAIKPMPAVFSTDWVRRLDGPNVKKGTKKQQAEALIADIRGFLEKNKCARGVMIWTGSTEVYAEVGPAHLTIEAFEAGLEKDDPTIAPSMIYAYAAIKTGCAYLNGAPNLSADIPALRELAEIQGVPTGGKDFKTGQTLMKTTIAPMLHARLLGLQGWFSTNILGNRDGEVLDDAASFKTKEVSKLSVLETILDPEKHPALYSNIKHKVTIHYYPPRGDNKEGWDAIDIVGWLGYPMQIKINFQCRDSILAAPLAIDLALLADLAQRAGEKGPQEWLSFFFKSPVTVPGHETIHDLFQQQSHLQEKLRGYAQRVAEGRTSKVG
ncbi:inositol-3-phosphate synthase [Anaeromyxobacter paludicola]|uniref:Myo-inositol-1-phosphate synthase n=1 Tax=Anaeromyxobacter paludicola TaxID=2918171 RepID=A0ABN6NC04_9BACT|nr:inositol-3-phosphate synthase [Anaeromyxobacter paludicola]BDG09946.1 myo-inositol-1-phosphate synthase [Anaeromyxobacter paludicola]